MKRTKVWQVIVLAALTPLALSACGGSAKPDGTTSGKSIVLGTSLPLTGALGQFGIDLQAGYQEKLSEVNTAGGLDIGGAKRKLTLRVLDNRSDPNTATQQVRELILKDNATALLGGCTPPIVVPEALAAEQQKVPFVSSCNPTRAFQAGNKAGWKYAWDLFFDEQDQATTVAKVLATATSNRRAALFTDNEPDGVAERPLYKAAFARAGLEVVGDYSFPVGTTDFSSFVNDAKSKGAQLVAGQMIPPDGIALWKQMKALSFRPVMPFVSKAAVAATWPQALGAVAEGTLTEGFWSAANGNTGSAQIQATLGKKYAKSFADLNIAALGYTVAAVVTDGIKTAGSTDHVKINDAIGKTNALYPLGKISFGPAHTAATPYLVLQWQRGNLLQVLPAASGVSIEAPAIGLRG